MNFTATPSHHDVRFADRYTNYLHLAEHETEGRDYRRVTHTVTRSPVAIIAPHAGGIEPGTSAITRGLAGNDFNFYLFEGIKARGNKFLHVTSRHFDEPRCLELIARCETVIAIHGCKAEDECVFLGGLASDLKQGLAAALRRARIRVETTGHKFPAIDPDNICNRGRSGAGLQIEISGPLRRSGNIRIMIEAMRGILMRSGTTLTAAIP